MALPTYFCHSNEKLTQEVRVVNVFERDIYSEVPKHDIYSEVPKRDIYSEVPKHDIYNEVPECDIYSKVPLKDLKAWSCKDEGGAYQSRAGRSHIEKAGSYRGITIRL